MTTARDMILRNFNAQQVASFNAIFDFLILSAPDSARQELAALLNPWRPIEQKLWLWKNGDHYLAFDNAYPCHPGGDPMTLGEPAATAMFRPSLPAPPSEDKA